MKYLIVGLGNPGDKYEETRHNIGFKVVDLFTRQMNGKFASNKLADVAEVKLKGRTIILIKPTTFMNLSGEAVQAVTHFYKVPPEQVIVIHDELDIPFGQIRTRVGGSDAGHNGIKSLIEQVSPNFGRVRIGVHNDMADRAESKDFVLGKFSKEEQKHLPALTREVTAIVSEYIHGQPLAHETRSFLI